MTDLRNFLPLSKDNHVRNRIVMLDAGFRRNLEMALAAMPADLRAEIVIGKAWRTRAEQEWLHHEYKTGRGGSADEPGTSLHEKGLAVDIYPRNGHYSDMYYLPFHPYRAALQWLYEHGPAYGVEGLSTKTWFGNDIHDPEGVSHFQRLDTTPTQIGQRPSFWARVKGWFTA